MLRASLLTATYMEVMSVKQNKQSYQVGLGLGGAARRNRQATRAGRQLSRSRPVSFVAGTCTYLTTTVLVAPRRR